VKELVAEPAPGFVLGVGHRWVRREDSGRLVLVEGKVQKQIASARCGARILRADITSGMFLIACEEYAPKPPPKTERNSKPKYRFDLYLIRPGFVRSLHADVMRTGVDFAGPPESRLFVVRPGAEAALVDFRARKMTPLPGHLQVLVTSPTGALLRRGRKLSLWSERQEENVDIDVPALAPLLIDGSAASVDHTMFLLNDELTSWNLPAAPLAITSQGYALIPKKAATLAHAAEGPLLLLGPPSSKKQEAPPGDEAKALHSPAR
jgi:hypothetical protein